MATTPRHVILRATLEFVAPDLERASRLQETFSRVFHSKLLPLADRLMTAANLGNVQTRIERLKIDLGVLDPNHLDEQIVERFAKALAEALRRELPSPTSWSQPEAQTANERLDPHLRLIRSFLLRGSLPWWWSADLPGGIDPLLRRLATDMTAQLRTLLRDVGRQSAVRRRLILQLREKTLHRVVEVLEPANAGFIIDYAKALQEEHEADPITPVSAEDFRQAKWEMILRHLLVDRGSEFNRKEFLRSTISGLAHRFRLDYTELLRELARPVDGEAPAHRMAPIVRWIRELWRESQEDWRLRQRPSQGQAFESKTPLDVAGFHDGHFPESHQHDLLLYQCRATAASDAADASSHRPRQRQDGAPIELFRLLLAAFTQDSLDSRIVAATRTMDWRWATTEFVRWPSRIRRETWLTLSWKVQPQCLARRIVRQIPEGILPLFVGAIAGTTVTAMVHRLLSAPPFSGPVPGGTRFVAPRSWVWEAVLTSMSARPTPALYDWEEEWVRRLLPQLFSRFRTAGRTGEFLAWLSRTSLGVGVFTGVPDSSSIPPHHHTAWFAAFRFLRRARRQKGSPAAMTRAFLREMAGTTRIAETTVNSGRDLADRRPLRPDWTRPLDPASFFHHPQRAFQVLERFLDQGRVVPPWALHDLPGGPDALLVRLLARHRRVALHLIRRPGSPWAQFDRVARRFSDEALASLVHTIIPEFAPHLLSTVRLLLSPHWQAKEPRATPAGFRRVAWSVTLRLAHRRSTSHRTMRIVIEDLLEAIAPFLGRPTSLLASSLTEVLPAHAPEPEHPRQLEAVLRRLAIPTPIHRAPTKDTPSPDSTAGDFIAWLDFELRGKGPVALAKSAAGSHRVEVAVARWVRVAPASSRLLLRTWLSDRIHRQRCIAVLSDDSLEFLVSQLAGNQAAPGGQLIHHLARTARQAAPTHVSPRALRRFIWESGLQLLFSAHPPGDLTTLARLTMGRLEAQFAIDRGVQVQWLTEASDELASRFDEDILGPKARPLTADEPSPDPPVESKVDSPSVSSSLQPGPEGRGTGGDLRHFVEELLVDAEIRQRLGRPARVDDLRLRLGDRPETFRRILRLLVREPSLMTRWILAFDDRTLERWTSGSGLRLPRHLRTYLMAPSFPSSGTAPFAGLRRAWWQGWFELAALRRSTSWTLAEWVRHHLACLAGIAGLGHTGLATLKSYVQTLLAALPDATTRPLIVILKTQTGIAPRQRRVQPPRGGRVLVVRSRTADEFVVRLRLWRDFLRRPGQFDAGVLQRLWRAAAGDRLALYAEYLSESPLTLSAARHAVSSGGFAVLTGILTGNETPWISRFVKWFDWIEHSPLVRAWLPYSGVELQARALMTLSSLYRSGRRPPVSPPQLIVEILVRTGAWNRIRSRAFVHLQPLDLADDARTMFLSWPPSWGIARLLRTGLERSTVRPPRELLDSLTAMPPPLDSKPPGASHDGLPLPTHAIQPHEGSARPMPAHQTSSELTRVKPTTSSLDDVGEVGEPIFVTNAGLVLVAPFFPVYFDRCTLLEDGRFRGHSDAERAILLTQYLLTFDQTAFEHTLALNKILCGVEIHEPVPMSVELTEDERAVGRDLLDNVIRQWNRVTLTPVGFRDSFLWRPGKLTHTEESWKLVVERRTYDILLSSLPWTFSVIKASYMPLPLFVSWI